MKVFFLVLVYVINFSYFNLFKFLAAILEKGLLNHRNNASGAIVCQTSKFKAKFVTRSFIF